MSRASLFLAALALLAPAAAVAQAAPAAHAAAPSAAAMRIAMLLTSQPLIDAQLANILKATRASLAATPNFQQMEQRWPGLTDEFIATMQPIMAKATGARLPAYRAKVAALFASHMTPDELTATGDMYASPAGIKLLRLMLGNMDYSTMLKQQIDSGGTAKISGNDIHSTVMGAAIPAVMQMTPAERAQIVAFNASPAGLKLTAFAPQLQQLAADENNQQDPAAEAEVTQAVEALIQRHLAADAEKKTP